MQPGRQQQVDILAEVLDPVDVVVAGGGTAGCTAAIAAAKTGARVALIEQTGALGGMMTTGNAGLTMYMKWSGDPAEQAKDTATLATTPETVQVAGGLCAEITQRLLDSGAGIGTDGAAGRYVFTAADDFKRLLLELVDKAGVALRLHSWVTEVLHEDGRLTGLVLFSKSGFQILPAKQFIDTTGDGDVAARSGVPFHKGVTPDDLCMTQSTLGTMQNMGVMFRIGNVDLTGAFNWLQEHPERYAKHPFGRQSLEAARTCAEKGEMATFSILTDAVPRQVHFYNSPLPRVVTACCPQIMGRDGTKVEDLTAAEKTIATMVKRWMEGIRNIPGFENAFLLDCPEIGVRETRHIQGDYLLTLEDIYHQKSFTDCIGFGSHPIDTTPRPEWLNDPETAYPPRWQFEIPFRCLLAKGKENLLVAGRCLSATHEAFGCIRPTVQCMITGEAAGAAAGLCTTKQIELRELDHRELRSYLREQGVKC